jgi:thymidylate kinase
MLIVLEGCDGSGKTTLAKKLAELLNAEIIHCRQYTPNDYEFFSDIVTTSIHKNIIADRFCYGQYIYQDENDRPLGYVHNLHRLELEMLEAGTKVIFVTATDEEIEDRLSLRRERPINGLSVKEVQARYRGTFKCSILPIQEWSTSLKEEEYNVI